MFSKLFKKTESLLAIDIGSTGIKLVELDLTGEKPELINLASAALSGDVFSNHMIQKPEVVAEQIGALLEANGIEGVRVVTAMPGPSVFTKRIKMPKSSSSELAAAVQLEAANFIPHDIDAVKLDFQVLGSFGKNQLDVLVVAVKNEILEGFAEAIALAGLETAVVDVDYFALQNIFEHSYPDLISRTTALINVGQRYSSISICRNGESLFTGDMSAGGRSLDEALTNQLSISGETLAAVKRGLGKAMPSGVDAQQVAGVVSGVAEELAVEFNRQLSFFWNAAGADEGIEQIYLAGGTAVLPGLLDNLKIHTGLQCEIVDPFRAIEVGSAFDAEYLKEVGPGMAVAVGLALRSPGDKETDVDLESEE